MRKPGGYLSIDAYDAEDRKVVLNGTTIRDSAADTFTCGHCHRIVAVKPFCDAADAGGLCKQCMTLICPACVDLAVCTPMEKQLEQWEAKVRFRESMKEWG